MDNKLDLMFKVGGVGQFKLSALCGVGNVRPFMVAVKEDEGQALDPGTITSHKKQDGWCFDVHLINGMSFCMHDKEWNQHQAQKTQEGILQRDETLEMLSYLSGATIAPKTKIEVQKPHIVTP